MNRTQRCSCGDFSKLTTPYRRTILEPFIQPSNITAKQTNQFAEIRPNILLENNTDDLSSCCQCTTEHQTPHCLTLTKHELDCNTNIARFSKRESPVTNIRANVLLPVVAINKPLCLVRKKP